MLRFVLIDLWLCNCSHDIYRHHHHHPVHGIYGCQTAVTFLFLVYIGKFMIKKFIAGQMIQEEQMTESLNSVTLQREVNVALEHDNTNSNGSETLGNNQSDIYFIAKVRILTSSGNIISSSTYSTFGK